MTWQHLQIEGLTYTLGLTAAFQEGKRYPMILFLHGAGTRGTNLEVLEANTISKYAQSHEDFPFVLVMPLCTEETWFDHWQALKALVQHMAQLPFGDPDRFYLTGNSMGGYGSWQLAMSIPQYFAALAPVCGGGMYWNAKRLKDIPVWAFHGALDKTVLPEESLHMVSKINDFGGNAKLTVYPKNAHDAWTDTYSDPALYTWLLAQKKQ